MKKYVCSCIKFTTISVNSKSLKGNNTLVFKTDNCSWCFVPFQQRESLIEWKPSLWRREKLYDLRTLTMLQNTHETWLLKVDRWWLEKTVSDRRKSEFEETAQSSFLWSRKQEVVWSMVYHWGHLLVLTG